MTVYRINPLTDPRWPEFLERHPQSSVFHTTGWLRALQRTYEYKPVVYTTSGPGRALTSGIPFCQVRSWITGHRLVSLPFSDHCEPLVERDEELQELLLTLQQDVRNGKWKYIELRPVSANGNFIQTEQSYTKSKGYYLHKLDLSPELDTIFGNFHKTFIRAKIRRAEREQVVYEKGRSEDLLNRFYNLQVKTRRIHQIPPQPFTWFHNLVECLKEAVDIHVVSKDGKTIGSIMTMTYKSTVFFKYGCRDPELDRLGLNRILFWRSICQGKEAGASTYDMGRTQLDNSGLIDFKDRWGATRSSIGDYTYPRRNSDVAGDGWKMQVANNIFPRLPDWALKLSGELLYRHIG